MTKRIVDTGPVMRRIVDTGKTLGRVDPEAVAKALGADTPDEPIAAPTAPPVFLALRDELTRRLQSTGGRPALEGADRRPKIPMSDAMWSACEAIAAACATAGFHPTAGQVASVLIAAGLRQVAILPEPVAPQGSTPAPGTTTAHD